ncbi:envelope stress response membrane protein PspB [Xenorhabdus sp. 42]|uniref:Envelope stress response membrane protein PspB n=1 Tax=Xenorhabdus szentirmaii TaxID=290112 RepID=A0AAW3YWQ7_9GAMM|nr:MULTISPECIES: envelope stress response membrane protein PspB [Xenorhabdus]MBD2780339.1 envelope stress response membrane protein PspB [Xenorhabdus sp. 38]MBD2793357.1 envelope stress response membrane protein PspB [Xenorhabdus sp. CUL]MBD2802640.1 envelope stress response membrane protein PspB [Xenorhabdus sp. M]MBD2804604.1 envelope stress response membrane protein PspB [Xenorhabdus sp. ZM]MBD2819635.1 envelope stress response membrane protein PspB [Xenorhabdus sp. 42]
MGYIFLMIPLIIFVLFVLPIWLWLHYSNRNVNQSQLGNNEMQRLEQLTENARRMQERIKTLEDILDAEHPNWRQS